VQPLPQLTVIGATREPEDLFDRVLVNRQAAAP
jgi:hypothetical protein